MNKIDFPRIGFDGIEHAKDWIENFYYNEFFKIIQEKLQLIPSKLKITNHELHVIEAIIWNLKRILLACPSTLEKYSKLWDQSIVKYKLTKEIIKELGKAFDYTSHRKNGLIKFAKYLNVKSCPYCNMHYTLYAEISGGTEKLAKFQFDHFYPKKVYPILSMSLYNLIPSCSICNHTKSTKTSMSLDFHPYHSDISKIFKFRLHDPLKVYSGRIIDEIDIDLIANDPNLQQEVDTFSNAFHLKTLYQRHGDIAQEVFDKAYEYPYYSNPDNFKWLSNCQPDYIKRLWMGTYISEQDIHKRPMTKFIQDLWEQARGIKASITQGRAT